MIAECGMGWRGCLIRLYGDLVLKGRYRRSLGLCLKKRRCKYVYIKDRGKDGMSLYFILYTVYSWSKWIAIPLF